MKIGDKIEVIDMSVSPYLIRGEVLELDEHPLANSFARIKVLDSPALPVPIIWVNIRLAKVM